MYEHNALGYWSGLALCLTKVRSSRARCPATALIYFTSILQKPQETYICIFESADVGVIVFGISSK